MKRLICLLTAFLIILSLCPLNVQAESFFNENQLRYLDENKDKTLHLGLSPYSGSDYFEYKGKMHGYLFDVIKLIEEQTGLRIEVVADRPWSEITSGLKTGDIDLISGANATEERMEFMSFTRPVHKYPYAVFAKKKSGIQSIGDLDLKRMGFIRGDNGRDEFFKIYKNIHPKEVSFDTQDESFKALSDGSIDGFLSSGGIVADDYLPFDYYNEGNYQGIGGSVLNEIASLVGIKLTVVHGSFERVYNLGLNRQVDILNMAKTNDRLEHFIFPSPFSEERDQIYGKRTSPHIQDVYGLEGKTVAVIDGFWHKEFLIKNLEDVDILPTESIENSLELVNKGKADYFIENPTVAEFYINGLGYSDIVKKGSTSADSFLYFGVNNEKPQLASIMDKAVKVISYDSLKDKGLMNIPSLTPVKYTRLFYIIIALISALFIIGFLMFRILKSLADERAKSQLLSERNELIYTDALTGLKNRMYFKDMETEFDSMPFPQIIIHADVNDLKKVNDNYGHHMGDKLIIGSSEILKSVFDDSLILRMGGDEFLIVAYKKTCEEINEKIILVNEIAGFTVLDDSVSSIKGFSIAMGFSIRNSPLESFDDTMIDSDNNMYIHKNLLKKAAD